MLVDRLRLPIRPEEHVLFKKQLTEIIENTATNRRLLENIEKIRLTYTLNTACTGIPEYVDENEDYREIDIFEVRLYSYKGVAKIGSLLGQVIPRPLIIFLTTEERTALALARLRINQNDNTRLTVADSLLLEDISEASPAYTVLNAILPRAADIRAIYYDYYDAMSVERLRLAADLEQIINISGDRARAIYRELTELAARLTTLRRELKTDKNLNANVRRNMELVACKRRQRAIIQELKG